MASNWITLKNKNEPKEGDKNYFRMKKEVFENASNKLSRVGLDLFMFIYCFNAEGIAFELSQSYFVKIYKHGKASYQRAFRELIEKDFLRKTEHGYDFYAKGEKKDEGR